MNIGTQPLLDAMADLLPSPADRGEARGTDPRNRSEISRRPVPEEPYSAFVFRTIADPFSGRISLFRVYSGTIKSDTTVNNVTRGAAERFGAISLMQGKDLIHVTEVRAGDIAAVPKLKETHTGDTLSDKAHPILYKPVVFPEPSISFAIEPKSRGRRGQDLQRPGPHRRRGPDHQGVPGLPDRARCSSRAPASSTWRSRWPR